MWSKRARAWATYCIVVFLPWDSHLETRLKGGVDWLEQWSQSVLSTPHRDAEGTINRARITAMLNATQALSVKKKEKKLCSQWKFRAADRFGKEEFAELLGFDGLPARKHNDRAVDTAALLQALADIQAHSDWTHLRTASLTRCP